MADDIDRASEIETARVLASITAISREVRSVSDAVECIECGDDIEEERRRAMPNARRCFTCQKLLENQTRVRRF